MAKRVIELISNDPQQVLRIAVALNKVGDEVDQFGTQTGTMILGGGTASTLSDEVSVLGGLNASDLNA